MTESLTTFKFPTQTTPWPTNDLRRASVNSFGFGGSNSHAVLDDAYHYLELHHLSGKHCTSISPRLPISGQVNNQTTSQVKAIPDARMTSDMLRCRRSAVFVFSAFDEPGLHRLALSYQKYFTEKSSFGNDEEFWRSLAYTLAEKRSKLPWKSFAVLSSIPELPTEMKDLISRPVRSPKELNLGFVFTGQGAHWSAMGRELVKYPVFEESLTSANIYLRTIGCRSTFIGTYIKLSFLILSNPCQMNF